MRIGDGGSGAQSEPFRSLAASHLLHLRLEHARRERFELPVPAPQPPDPPRVVRKLPEDGERALLRAHDVE